MDNISIKIDENGMGFFIKHYGDFVSTLQANYKTKGLFQPFLPDLPIDKQVYIIEFNFYCRNLKNIKTEIVEKLILEANKIADELEMILSIIEKRDIGHKMEEFGFELLNTNFIIEIKQNTKTYNQYSSRIEKIFIRYPKS